MSLIAFAIFLKLEESILSKNSFFYKNNEQAKIIIKTNLFNWD